MSTPLRRTALLACVAAFVTAPAAPVSAQYFGKNQVQYKHFRWRVLETEHFRIHYYPEEREPIMDAARMAERSYERLSRILGHQFREKKPIIFFASRADFAQNNIFGDLGEGVGGVTEAMRHRLIMPFSGDYHSFEHVLAHEMVHEFQYDVLQRGRAGQNLQVLSQLDLPLWFMEGMAEYLSIGPRHALTDVYMRDAAVNGNIPTIRQMTERPDRWFPYRFGEALFQYIGSRWGDAAIGAILQSVPAVGVERAIRRELGLTAEELSDDWREATQAKFLPMVATLQRPNQFASPLLNPRRTSGDIFLAPALSNDGRHIAFLADGERSRGDIFIDLWLADAQTGRRIRKLVASTLNPDFEELRLLYSQSAFSNDGQRLAFTAQRAGRDVLYVINVRDQRTVQRIEMPLDGVTSPSWSPDDRRIVFSGSRGGITDLYVVDADGGNLRQLTDDKYGDVQPSWSPDGQWVAWSSERDVTNLETLELGRWQIALLNTETGETRRIHGQAGLNINPVWAPDARSIIFVSDRDGIPNLYLYDLAEGNHYQLTNAVSGISAITEYSPVITWARGADRLAFAYYENGSYTVWTIDNPRSLRRAALVAEPVAAAAAAEQVSEPPPATAATPEQVSVYRAPSGARPSSELSPAEMVRAEAMVGVTELHADPEFGLPDTTRFRDYEYRPRLRADHIITTDVGYTPNYYGTHGFSGGTMLVFNDLIGNHQLAVAGQVNGRLQDGSIFAGYANFSRRFQFSTGGFIQPQMFPTGVTFSEQPGGRGHVRYDIVRFVQRNAFLVGMYPFNRFSRFEAGVQYNNIGRSLVQFDFEVLPGGFATGGSFQTVKKLPTLSFASPNLALVTDNALFGYTGPLAGRRARLDVTSTIGSVRKMDYLLDARNYLPIRLGTLTFATRLYASVAVGRDENLFPKYIGRPDFVRGYDRASLFSGGVVCNSVLGTEVAGQPGNACSQVEMVGSRVAVANAEMRFPIIRRFELGAFGLPPIDGVLFYDAGVAWSAGQQVSLRKPAGYDPELQRYAFTSWGGGVRVNLFNMAILRWDYAIPMATETRKPNWTFSLGPSF